jgi:hypothetical protein
VEILEHLLGLYRLPLERYRAVLGAHDPEVQGLLSRVRRLAGMAAFDAAPAARPAGA